MQLGTSLSYIEDIKEGMQKRYNALKAMLKKYNEIPSGEKNRAVKYAKEMSEDATKVPEKAKDVEILEVDELFSYCQKKLPECTYGLLLIGTEMKLLISNALYEQHNIVY